MANAKRILKAEISVSFKSKASLQAIRKAMIVDEAHQPNSKASVKTTSRKNILILNIQADDIPSLRASLNSNLRLIITWIKIVRALPNPKA